MMRKRRSTKQNNSILRDELFLQPWFLPKPTYLTLRKLLPSSQLLKMRYYFDDYGCMKCGDRAALYASNGLCKGCSIIVRARIALCLARRFKKVGTRMDRVALRRFINELHQSGKTPVLLGQCKPAVGSRTEVEGKKRTLNNTCEKHRGRRGTGATHQRLSARESDALSGVG